MVSRDEVLSPLLGVNRAFSWSTAGTSLVPVPSRAIASRTRGSRHSDHSRISSLLDYVAQSTTGPAVTAQPRASSEGPKPGTARSSSSADGKMPAEW